MEIAQPRDAATGTTGHHHGSRFARLRATTLVRVVTAYGSTQTGSYAPGLAFNAFMAMFPMILGALAITGLVVSNAGIRNEAQTAILRAFPGRSGVELNAVVTQDLHHYAGLLGIVGVLGLLWACTNFFASLEFCLGRIFGIGQRGFLRQRAMGAVMMLVLVVSLLIAVAANTLMSLVPVMTGPGPVAGFLAMAALTLIIYRLVPNRTFRIRQLWPGAVVAGLLIELVTLLFPLYAKMVHGFDTYGQSLALFFLLATWLAFLSQFILIGALWNRVRLGEEFTASGLLASGLASPASPASAGSTASSGSPASPGSTASSASPASGHDAVATSRETAGDDRMTGEVAVSPHPAPRRLRRPKPDP